MFIFQILYEYNYSQTPQTLGRKRRTHPSLTDYYAYLSDLGKTIWILFPGIVEKHSFKRWCRSLWKMNPFIEREEDVGCLPGGTWPSHSHRGLEVYGVHWKDEISADWTGVGLFPFHSEELLRRWHRQGCCMGQINQGLSWHSARKLVGW